LVQFLLMTRRGEESIMRTMNALAVALMAITPAAPAYAGEPMDTVRGGVERAMTVLADPGLTGDAHTAERHKELRAIAGALFDFSGMSRQALGTHWRERTPDERQKFVALFTDLLQNTYVAKIDTASAGSTVRYDAEDLHGDAATVRTTIATAKGTEIPVTYRLVRKENRWLIDDVDFGGVTLVSNYRAQFNQIIRSSSFEMLVQRLDKKPLGGSKPSGSGG
jgi:phospholipid transport system substrate-binding protein